MSRDWSPMRAAYYPRLWPIMLVAVLLSAPLGGVAGALLGTYGILVGALIGALIGWSVAHLRWARWRKDHPERPYSQWQSEPQR